MTIITLHHLCFGHRVNSSLIVWTSVFFFRELRSLRKIPRSKKSPTILHNNLPGGGGALNFFQVGVCGPDFQSVGLANWYLPLKRGLVNWKFPNLGACELKISKFGGLWAKLWVKIEAVKAKISKFSQKGVLWTDSFAWNGALANYRRGVKRGSLGPHIPIPPF